MSKTPKNKVVMKFRKSGNASLKNRKGLSIHFIVLAIIVVIHFPFAFTVHATNAVAQNQTEKTNIGDDDVLTIAEIMPLFPGGELAMRKFIAKAVRYPAAASENGIQGRVFVKFIVDKEGVVTDAKIARGVEATIDKEAIRVIMSLPKWSPGMHDGKAVNVSIMFPISFQLR